MPELIILKVEGFCFDSWSVCFQPVVPQVERAHGEEVLLRHGIWEAGRGGEVGRDLSRTHLR